MHDSMEPPFIDPFQLPFTLPAPILDGPTSVCLAVPVEPLLPKGRQEGRKQRGTKSSIKRGLGLTDGRIGPSPAWGGDWLTGRDISKGNVEEKLQEGVVHFFVVWFEF